MIGFKITGHTIVGLKITAIIVDKINVPVLMQVGSRLDANHQQVMMNSDVYCCIDADSKLHFVKPDEIILVTPTEFHNATEYVSHLIINQGYDEAQ